MISVLTPRCLLFSHRSHCFNSCFDASSILTLRRIRGSTLDIHLCVVSPHRRSSSSVAAALRKDTNAWTQAPLSMVEVAAESYFHISIDLSDCPHIARSHMRPGQYLQLRHAKYSKSAFLSIASSPSVAASHCQFEFLVRSVPGTVAEVLCGLKKGDIVELSAVMGDGFSIDQISPPDIFPTVLIFATGSGISAIRSLVESGFGAEKRADVRLYYGAKNLQRMAYQDRFKDWEASGVKILPVLSRPDYSWNGERGYVQAAFVRDKQISNPVNTGAVLCGHKGMTEEVISILKAEGIADGKILRNF